jgi:hypothetical protein
MLFLTVRTKLEEVRAFFVRFFQILSLQLKKKKTFVFHMQRDT